ncbi:MAG TPA: hypothetical protein VF530_02465 [Planctomycetota bacterium]
MNRRRRRQLGTLLEVGRGGLWFGTGLLGLLCLFFAVDGSRHGASALALYLAGTALGLCLARARHPWRPVLMLACQLVLLAGLGAWLSRGPGQWDLPIEGDRLLQALEQHRAQHGRYPPTLSAAGCEPQWNAFGGWQYESVDGGASYHIWVGDYLEDGFVLYRYHHYPRWAWDT